MITAFLSEDSDDGGPFVSELSSLKGEHPELKCFTFINIYTYAILGRKSSLDFLSDLLNFKGSPKMVDASVQTKIKSDESFLSERKKSKRYRNALTQTEEDYKPPDYLIGSQTKILSETKDCSVRKPESIETASVMTQTDIISAFTSITTAACPDSVCIPSASTPFKSIKSLSTVDPMHKETTYFYEAVDDEANCAFTYRKIHDFNANNATESDQIADQQRKSVKKNKVEEAQRQESNVVEKPSEKLRKKSVLFQEPDEESARIIIGNDFTNVGFSKVGLNNTSLCDADKISSILRNANLNCQEKGSICLKDAYHSPSETEWNFPTHVDASRRKKYSDEQQPSSCTSKAVPELSPTCFLVQSNESIRAYTSISLYHLLKGNLNRMNELLLEFDSLIRTSFERQLETNYFVRPFLEDMNNAILSSKNICSKFTVEDDDFLLIQLNKMKTRKDNIEKAISRQLKKTDKLLRKLS